MGRPIAVGQKFSRWTVVAEQKGGWLCRCDCGTERAVKPFDLTSGKSKSCNCLRDEGNRVRHIKHGQSGSPEYTAWLGMRERCTNPNTKQWKDYGGRGIKVCRRWETFENFLEDMGEKPSPEHTLDRKNNDGNYTPKNCRWATRAVQNNNRRSKRLVTFNGVTKSITEWTQSLGLASGALQNRLSRGMTMKEALTKPKRIRDRPITLNGVTRTMAEWCTTLGVSKSAVHNRLAQGWTLEDALTKPKQHRWSRRGGQPLDEN